MIMLLWVLTDMTYFTANPAEDITYLYRSFASHLLFPTWAHNAQCYIPIDTNLPFSNDLYAASPIEHTNRYSLHQP